MSSLSERLDEARKAREKGVAPGLESSAFHLRARIERPAYDGTSIRTGEQLTSDDWAERRGAITGGLDKILTARDLQDEQDEADAASGAVIDLVRIESAESEVDVDLTAPSGSDTTAAL